MTAVTVGCTGFMSHVVWFWKTDSAWNSTVWCLLTNLGQAGCHWNVSNHWWWQYLCGFRMPGCVLSWACMWTVFIIAVLQELIRIKCSHRERRMWIIKDFAPHPWATEDILFQCDCYGLFFYVSPYPHDPFPNLLHLGTSDWKHPQHLIKDPPPIPLFRPSQKLTSAYFLCE